MEGVMMNEQALDTNQAKTKQPNKQITQKTTTNTK